MTTEHIPYFEDQDSKLKPELPNVERNNINVVIWNPETDEILCLDWEKFNWKTFVIGGIENNEDPVFAATREILEETGYKNIEFIAEIGKTKSGYFAAHKNENRISNTTGLLFKLINTDQDPVDEAESANHVMKWIAKDEVANYINLASQKYIWEKALEILRTK